MKRCIDCTHVKKGVAELPADSGECHLNPPTVVQQNDGRGTITAATYWPVVKDDNFCGSFSPSTACALGRGVTQQEPQHAGHVRPFDPSDPINGSPAGPSTISQG